MSEEAVLIATTDIIRTPGYLFYTKTDERGCITIWKAPMGKNKKKVVTQ
jgi:hypothetical protein